MPKRQDEKLFDEADVLIIAGLCLGMTQEVAGNWVATPAFPTGFTERTVRNRLAAHPEVIDRLMGRIASAFKKKEAEFEDLTRQQYREKIEKLRSKAVKVKELALDHAINNETDTEALNLGIKVAESVEDRDFGKAKQVVESAGDVNHHHFVWTQQTREQLLAQERDILASGDLLKALPGDVLEAEVVADA